ncbi:MAG TPA: hypothetical protein VMU42_13840 [Candidatus Sulfotelmatobacter sp.]|nr:hypothetical protein [Candidatus Sulfotelmatobacter sp.]
MAIRLEKAWLALDAASVRKLPGQLGVYQIAEADGTIVYIGYAGGRSLFGLRSEMARWLERREGKPTRFRYEVNMQYISRHQELLMLHVADHGALPAGNADIDQRKLGRLSPI